MTKINKDDVTRIVIDRHSDNAKTSIENKVMVKKYWMILKEWN